MSGGILVKLKWLAAAVFAVLLTLTYVGFSMGVAADLGKSGASKAPAAQERRASVVYLDEPSGERLERSYAGQSTFDEQYECQVQARGSKGLTADSGLNGKLYVWVRSDAASSRARYLVSRSAAFDEPVFQTTRTHWLNVEGGNAQQLCLDAAAVKSENGERRQACMLAFNREFPELTVYQGGDFPVSQGVCKRI